MSYRNNIRFRRQSSVLTGIGCLVPAMAIVLFGGAWLTHVIWIIKTLSSDIGATMGQIVLGLLGSFVFPIGIIHGFLLWFGLGA